MTALANVVWIGGAQWAGKTSVTRLLAARHPIVAYHYDYHDARSHALRAREDPGQFPALARFLRKLDTDPDEVWVRASPREMVETARGIFDEKFVMVCEDLAAMPDGVTVVAEGWGLRPQLLAPFLSVPKRAIFLVPTEAFRDRQSRELERAKALSVPGLSDAGRAQRNRLERDVILAREMVDQARQLGLRVLEIDGSEPEETIAEHVEEQFRAFLPPWLY